MTKSSEELTFVAIEGTSLPHSHAVLIETSRGWHVELEDVPSDSCPLVRAECDREAAQWGPDPRFAVHASGWPAPRARLLMRTVSTIHPRTIMSEVAVKEKQIQ